MEPSIAQAARSLVGTPFRLHGHDPQTGLDCVGLVGAALRAAGRAPLYPKSYSLRQRGGLGEYLSLARRNGFERRTGKPAAGDIALFGLEGWQHHLAIALDDRSIVHAHAGLGRTVIGQADDDWHLLALWRVP